MKLAHLSDLHVLDLTGVRIQQFLNKRVTGLGNLVSFRRHAHSTDILEDVVADIQAQGIDHVVVTGDLTNLSLDSEFQRAQELLAPIADFAKLTLVPGNHDVYTRGARRTLRFEKYFAHLLRRAGDGDGPLEYPIVKRVGPLRVVGLSSALPRLPFLAYGHVGSDQLERLSALAGPDGFQDGFTVALVHHNLHPRGWRKDRMHGLVNRAAVLDACQRAGVRMLLHGHTHVAHHFVYRTMHVVGCGSSTWEAEHPDHIARYNVYEFDEGRLAHVEARVLDRPGKGFVSRSLPALMAQDERTAVRA